MDAGNWHEFDKSLELLRQEVRLSFQRNEEEISKLRADIARLFSKLSETNKLQSRRLDELEDVVQSLKPWVAAVKWFILIVGGLVVTASAGVLLTNIASGIAAGVGLP